MEDIDKPILYLGGGALAAIHGAGLLVGLLDIGIKSEDFHKILAVSAGAANGYHFLTGRTKGVDGSSTVNVYYEDLTHDFIKPWNVIPGALQRIGMGIGLPIDRNKILNGVEIDYAIDCIERRSPGLFKDVSKSSVPFYIKLFHVGRGLVEYFDVKDDSRQRLLEGMSLIPWYNPKGREWVDAEIVEPLGLERIMNMPGNEGRRVIAIMNYPLEAWAHRNVKTWIEGRFASMMYPCVGMTQLLHGRVDSLRKDAEFAEKYKKDVLVIVPPDKNPIRPITTNVGKMMTSFRMGYESRLKVRDFIRAN